MTLPTVVANQRLVLLLREDVLFQDLNRNEDSRMQRDDTPLIGGDRFIYRSKYRAAAFGLFVVHRQIEAAKNHILRRRNDQASRLSGLKCFRSQHEQTRFRLRFRGQRYVNRHLVTVKVSVISRTYERVKT